VPWNNNESLKVITKLGQCSSLAMMINTRGVGFLDTPKPK